MKKYLYLCFATLSISLFCLFQFSGSFFKLDHASTQSWAIDQIRGDLAPFAAGGIRKSDVYATMQNRAPKEGFLHVKIQKGKTSFSSDQYFSSSERTRAKHIRNFFNSLVKRYRFPDVEFLICLLDAYDDRDPVSVPVWVFAKRDSTLGNVLIPDFEALNPSKRLAQYKQSVADHPWKTKKDTIFWRGATTGGIYEMDNYLQFPRVKLVFLSKEHPEWLDAAFTVLCQSSKEVLDTILRLSRPLSSYVGIPDHFAFKYLIDIDGNSCTYARCRWILLSNSALLKPFSHNIQWYYKALQPYVHYIPLAEDLSDLELTYEWLRTHDDEVHRIADEGRLLGLSIFSRDAIEDYFAALIYEYSQLYRADD